MRIIRIGGKARECTWFVPGFSLHEELRLFVEAGMPERQAIEAATRLPAEAYGLDGAGCTRPRIRPAVWKRTWLRFLKSFRGNDSAEA